MVILHWIFTNNHAWFKEFETVEKAEHHAELCGLYTNRVVDRVYIETVDGELWLKEKQGAAA